MPTIYCAGPITGTDYHGATDWYWALEAELGKIRIGSVIQLARPMRGKEYLESEGVLKDAYPDHPMSTASAILTRDHYDVTHCDMVIANLLGAEKVSIGTVMEVAWAHEARTPLILVIEPEGNIHDHPMLREAAGFRVESLTDAAKIAAATLAPYC